MNFDLNKKTLREVNQHLQNVDRKKNNRKFEILNPQGQHAICAGFGSKIFAEFTFGRCAIAWNSDATAT